NDLARKSYVDNKFSSVPIPNLQAVTDEGYITNNPINSKKTGGTWISADDDTGYAALNGSDEYSSIALRTVYGYASLSSSSTYTSLSLSKNNTFWVLSTEGDGIATLDSGNQLRVKQDPIHNNDLTRKAYVDNLVKDGVLTLSTGDGLTGSASFSANQSTNSTFTVGLGVNLANLNALSTSGFVKKTGANTWTIDTSTYLTSV